MENSRLVDMVDTFDYVTIALACMGILKTKFREETWRVKLNDSDKRITAKMLDGTLLAEKDGLWVEATNVAKQNLSTHILSDVAPNHNKDQFSKSSIQWIWWR